MSLWRHRDFLKLWTGQTVSLLGSQVTILALPLAAILLFHSTPFQVGALFSIQFLPFLLLGLPVGAWVDRLRRKPILIASDVLRFVAIGSIPVAHLLGVLQLAQLYVVALVQGVGTVFFDVAYGAYLPALVRRDRLVEGNAKLELSRSGAQLAGPGLGGILVQGFTAAGAMAADALSYLVSVVTLLLIRTPEPAPPPVDPVTGGMGRQVMDGIRFVRGQRLIRPILACTATLNFFGMMLEAVLLVFAVRRLGLTPGEIGFIFTLGTVGFVAGAIVAERVGRRLGPGPAIILAGLLCGGGALFVPFATRWNAWAVLIAWGLVAGVGGVIYNVTARSLMQALTPDRLLGRVIATNRVVVWGVIPLGSFLGGILGGAIGLRPTLWVAAIGESLGFVPPLFSRLRVLKELPASPDHSPDDAPSVGIGPPAIGAEPPPSLT